MQTTLKLRATVGMAWSALSQFIRLSANLIVTLALARLLGPEAFGLLGMVAIFTGFGTLFVELGLGAGLIQRQELIDDHINSAFWVNVLIGATLAALLAGGAPLIARFYEQPDLTLVAQVASLIFVFGGAGAVQTALLTRAMRFKAIAAIETLASVGSGSIGIAMAFNDFGVWALVAQVVSQSAIRTIGLWSVSSWRPKARFQRGAFDELLGFSGHLFGFNLFNYWVRNADNLLVGKFIGSQALGLYSRAYQFMLLPVQLISSIVGNVMFPTLSSVQSDLARLRRIYLRSIAAVHLIAAPIYAGLFAVADTFVVTILGDGWIELTPLLRILCLVGFFQPIGSSTGWLYMSLGRTDIMLKWGVVTGIVYVAAFFVGLKWGLLGVTWSYCIAGWLMWYPCWSIPARLAGMTFGAMLKSLLPASQCAIAMGLFVWAVGLALKTVASVPVIFCLQLLLGASFYFGLASLLRLESLQEMRALVGQRARSPA